MNDIINSIPLLGKKIIFDVVGDRKITYKNFLQEIKQIHFNEQSGTIIDIDGKSSIDNIIKYFAAIHSKLVPVMTPFKTGKLSNEVLNKRLINFNNLGIRQTFKFNQIPAMMQLSSGTTTDQKGYIISQEALLLNCINYAKSIKFDNKSIVVSWLPLNHDMGLITSLFLPVLLGAKSIIVPTEKWTVDYFSILKLIKQHKATHVWFPNFCFELLSSYQGRKLNLNNTIFINCSETARKDSVEKFKRKFDVDKIYSCYAMAENVFAVTQAQESNKSYKNIISSGKPVRGVEIKLNENSEILIKSNSFFSYILKNQRLVDPVLTSDGFFNTEDVGYLDEDGDLFVLGRSVDKAIVYGKNIILSDLDFEVSEIHGVKAGRVASFAIDEKGTQKVSILYEADKNLNNEIRKKIFDLFDITCEPYRVETKTIIKTTSGKISRKQNKELFLQRKKVFDIIQTYLRSCDFFDLIDETISLSTSGILSSFQIFDLISKISFALNTELNWSDDFTQLDKLSNFIDKFINFNLNDISLQPITDCKVYMLGDSHGVDFYNFLQNNIKIQQFQIIGGYGLCSYVDGASSRVAPDDYKNALDKFLQNMDKNSILLLSMTDVDSRIGLKDRFVKKEIYGKFLLNYQTIFEKINFIANPKLIIVLDFFPMAAYRACEQTISDSERDFARKQSIEAIKHIKENNVYLLTTYKDGVTQDKTTGVVLNPKMMKDSVHFDLNFKLSEDKTIADYLMEKILKLCLEQKIELIGIEKK